MALTTSPIHAGRDPIPQRRLLARSARIVMPSRQFVPALATVSVAHLRLTDWRANCFADDRPLPASLQPRAGPSGQEPVKTRWDGVERETTAMLSCNVIPQVNKGRGLREGRTGAGKRKRRMTSECLQTKELEPEGLGKSCPEHEPDRSSLAWVGSVSTQPKLPSMTVYSIREVPTYLR